MNLMLSPRAQRRRDEMTMIFRLSMNLAQQTSTYLSYHANPSRACPSFSSSSCSDRHHRHQTR
eukprot:5459504-Karenia_brevis.AAC.1